MTQITAQMVKDLREKTGAGMMDCKKALEETGDMEKAVAYLREKGLAQAAKKAGRVAADGSIGICVDKGVAAMVEVNCETDFVAKTPEFSQFVQDLAKQIAQDTTLQSISMGTGEQIATRPFMAEPGKTIEAVLNEKIAKIGEKIAIRRFVRLQEASCYGSYVHAGSSIGSLVALDVEDGSKASSEALLSLGRNVAMHVAASAPLYLKRDEVSAAQLEVERGIYRTQALEQGKPEAVVERIVAGKIEKYYTEVCLLEQAYVRDPDLNITKVLQATSKEMGTGIVLKKFVRFKVGEGIEKATADFASEVAKMVA